MLYEIKSLGGSVLYSCESGSLNQCIEVAVKNGANLRGANLLGAYLRGADLRGADLNGADLRFSAPRTPSPTRRGPHGGPGPARAGGRGVGRGPARSS